MEKLFQDTENIEKYQEMLKKSTQFIRDIGKIPDPQPQDVAVLMGIVVKDNPDSQYTSIEQAAMQRLQVDPKLIPYAQRCVSGYSRSSDMIIMQLYDGAANKERELEQFRTKLPNNVEQQAKEAIEKIIRHLQSSHSKEIDIVNFFKKRLYREQEN
ncbi:MAG TPA: hypothetical protein VN207_08265 [Ktedonobacteraceae bacterium]|nr:hypothetical protein [Ktedonobacteraceae bacterium]